MPTRRANRRDPARNPLAAQFAPGWVGCVWFPRFPVDLERQRRPSLAGRPVVLIGNAAESAVEQVLAVSAEAATSGLSAGMPAHAVTARCPHATALRYDARYYRRRLEALLLALDAVTPCLEPSGPSGGGTAVYLDLTDLPHLQATRPETVHRAVAALLPPETAFRLGISTGKFSAWCAAHSTKPGGPLLVEEGEKALFLAGLPVRLLPGEPPVLQQLDLMGVRSLGRLAGLPRSAVLARFGWPGERLHRLACGEDREPLESYRPQPVIRETHRFPHGAETVAEFEAALELLLARLWQRPERGCRGVRQVTLLAQAETGAWERTVTFRRTHEQGQTAFAELRRRLETGRPAGLLLELTVELAATAEALSCQPALFVAERERREAALGHEIDQLRTRLGRPAVYRLVEAVPHTYLPERRWKLIAYLPTSRPSTKASAPPSPAPAMNPPAKTAPHPPSTSRGRSTSPSTAAAPPGP